MEFERKKRRISDFSKEQNLKEKMNFERMLVDLHRMDDQYDNNSTYVMSTTVMYTLRGPKWYENSPNLTSGVSTRKSPKFKNRCWKLNLNATLMSN
jgi:hypothetical protein